MFARITEATGVDPAGLDEQVTRRRVVPVQPIADFHTVGARLRNFGESPQRHQPPTRTGREELPVAKRVAEHRVGDVVRGQPDTINAQQRFAVTNRRCSVMQQFGVRQVGPVDRKTP